MDMYFVLLVLVVMILGYLLWMAVSSFQRVKEEYKEQHFWADAAPPNAVKEKVDEAEDVKTMSANTLAQYYQENETKADTRYLGKVLDVNGEIEEIDKFQGKTIPRILGVDDKYNGTHVEIFLQNGEGVKQLTEGHEVLFRGLCKGLKTGQSPRGKDIGWISIMQSKIIDF